MTRAEARQRAVEAAARVLCACSGVDPNDIVSGVGYTGRDPQWTYFVEEAEEAATAYERAMADAGWRMARDVQAFNVDTRMPQETDTGAGVARVAQMAWNACRAEMLGDGDAPHIIEGAGMFKDYPR